VGEDDVVGNLDGGRVGDFVVVGFNVGFDVSLNVGVSVGLSVVFTVG